MSGAPSKYKPEYAEQARKLCLLGATDIELCDFFNVHKSTLNDWKLKYPELVEALKAGKDVADERVERSLYHKAIGYSFDSEKIFQFQGQIVKAPYREHLPPDTTACIFWLKNRRAHEWRDVQRHEHGKPGDFSAMSTDELDKFIAEGQGIIGGGDSREEPPRNHKDTRGSRRTH